MTLEEGLQELFILHDKRNELLNTIQQKHIHNSSDELVFYRYKNAGNEWLREHIRKGIGQGKDWNSLLDCFPLPDKPFDIEDIQDTGMKECFMRIQEIEKEEEVLGAYIRNTFEQSEIGRLYNQMFAEKYR